MSSHGLEASLYGAVIQTKPAYTRDGIHFDRMDVAQSIAEGMTMSEMPVDLEPNESHSGA